MLFRSETVVETENRVCIELGNLMRKHKKAVVIQSHYAHFQTAALDLMRKGGVPYYRSIEIASQCLASLADYSAMRRRLAQTASSASAKVSANGAVNKIIAAARAAGRTSLLETEAREVLSACGIEVPQSVLLKTPDDADKAAAKIGRAHV